MRQGSLYSIAVLAPLLVAAGVTPIVTRTLGAAEYGVLAIALAVMQVMQIPLALGLPGALNRHVVLEPSAAPGAAGQVVLVAAFLTLALTPLALTAATGLSVAGLGHLTPEIPVALAAAGLLALFNCLQSLHLGSANAVRFVTHALVLGLLPPIVGLLRTRGGEHTARDYLQGLVAAQLVAVATILFLTIRAYPPRFSWPDFRKGLSVGAPTVPHQLSSMALPPLLVAFAGWVEGSPSASGELQLALLVGSAPLVFLGALNNSWATRAYAVPHQSRSGFLSESSRVMAVVALALSWGAAIAAPWAIDWLAADDMDQNRMALAASIAASAAPLVVLYFANVHQVFAAGRTRGLAVTTPVSAAIAVGFAVTCLRLWPGAGIQALAASLIPLSLIHI